MGFPVCESIPPSGAQSPTDIPKEGTVPQTSEQFWSTCTASEVTRLVEVWREEVESVYPCFDMAEKISHAEHILNCIRSGRLIDGDRYDSTQATVTSRDIDLVKIAVATGIVLESHGKTEMSAAIIDSVERGISRISCLDVGLDKIQVLAALVAISHPYIAFSRPR